ncbi:MAG: WhiB family transcriptional regulator [Labedaea sp.]
MPVNLRRITTVHMPAELNQPDLGCVGADPDDFFPRNDERVAETTERLHRTAVFFCAPCPVRRLCQATGKTAGYGLWGGVLYLAPASLTASSRREFDLLKPKGDDR